MANVSQLKAVYLAGRAHPFYVALMTLLVLSIVLQLLSGLLLIWLSKLRFLSCSYPYPCSNCRVSVPGRININEPNESKHKQATLLSNMILVMVFILTLINIIVSSLGISNEPAYQNYTSLNVWYRLWFGCILENGDVLKLCILQTRSVCVYSLHLMV